ncbi:fumarylacetoacetate hydrolase family protein [Gordonia sp. (in: high G+C Gram-positive bacteria)]|uniref:fumarylacetoacetate hydrolase family protein n=1 Tax=Gordonia sp. (in: high G+C Gram-positive bacteria) TaxID=84139 RepID=UPI003529428E
MHLATIRTGTTTRAVKRVDSGTSPVLVDLGYVDLGALLADPDGLTKAAATDSGTTYDAATADFAPPVINPDKVICVSHNYGEHYRVLGLNIPESPRLSTKFSTALIGANDEIVKPADAHALDCAVELAIVIGRTVRHASDDEAAAAIAGFTVMNDVTDRDLEFQAEEWGLGNIWDRSTPIGPYLVTPDDLPGGIAPTLALTTTIDGRPVQSGSTADLHFDPVHVVRRASRFMELRPGDIVATGSPSSPAHDHGPEAHLQAGQRIVVSIDGVGECRNTVVAADA